MSKERPNSLVGYIKEPYHVPGYTGHIPTKQYRHGASFGNVSRKILEDPSVAQAPIPLLLPPVQKQNDPKNSKCSTSTPSSKEQEWSSQPSKTKPSPLKCNEEDYGIQVYQLPYWPKSKDPCGVGVSGSPLNVEVQEMLSAITPLPYLTQRDPEPESPRGTQRDQKDRNGGGIVESRSIGIQYSEKRDAKLHKKIAKRKDNNRSRKVMPNGRRAANRTGRPCSQVELVPPALSLECPDPGVNQYDLKVLPIKNRSPYVNSSYEDPLDTRIFRPSEGLPAAYSGHVPGKKFRSDGRSFGKVSYETKDFMESYGMFPVT